MMNCPTLDGLIRQQVLSTIKLSEAVTELSKNRNYESEQAVERAYEAREAMRRVIDAHLQTHCCLDAPEGG